MVQFTPWSALIGGMLIGLAALLLLLIGGRIAGISGIVSGVMQRPQQLEFWRIWFVVGLMLGGLLAWLGLGRPQPDWQQVPVEVMALAGLLVGVGSRLGNGCTSGHGICGIGRLSMRSMVATLTFMFTGVLTVAVLRHLL